MRSLQRIFTIIAICGCCRPSSWSSKWMKRIYFVYSVVVYLILHIFSLSQLLDLILNVRNADEFSESIYMFVATMLGCCKTNTILLNRRVIKGLARKLKEAPCKPMNREELRIQTSHDKRIGSIMIRYFSFVELTLICIIVSSLFTNFRRQELAYRAWLPYDYSSRKLYYLAYGHQIVALVFTAFLNVTCDAIVCILLVHTSALLEILKHRLKSITLETKSNIKDCVRYHNFIYRYAEMINRRFSITIGFQFFSSTLAVCFNLYQLSNMTTVNSKYFEIALYMVCMLAQIFLYCWFGHRLKLTSTEIITSAFEVDLIVYDKDARKDLSMIMRRAMVPIEFSSAYIVAMDLTTFVKILKLSYSVYNLLQRTKEK